MTNIMSVVDEDRALGTLLGLAIGDALGTTLEFSARDSQPAVGDLVGGGPFGLAPGEWTDDTSMALCLADSLIAQQDLDLYDLSHRFVRWWRKGENSTTGRCFDIGITTRRALSHFAQTGEILGLDLVDPLQAGNGSLMRLAPVALFAAPDISAAVRLAHLQSKATHPALTAHDGCAYFASLLTEAILGQSKEEVLRGRRFDGSSEVAAISAGSWRGKARHQISSSGYVVSTLEAAVWCVDRTASFEDALVLAVNLGDDSDTVGAVTGQLAGAIYGRGGIPERWLAKLAWREHIQERAVALLQAGAAARSSKGDR